MLTSARAGKGRSFRRPSTTSSRPSAAAPATRGRLVNRAVSVNAFRTLQNTRKTRKIILIRFHVLCYLPLGPLCTSTDWLDEASGSLVQQKVDAQARHEYGKATVGRREVLRTLRLRREAVQSLVDASDRSEVRLQSDQSGPMNCFSRGPLLEESCLEDGSSGRRDRGWRVQGSAGFFFFFFTKHMMCSKKKKENTFCQNGDGEGEVDVGLSADRGASKTFIGTNVNGKPSVFRW